MHWDSCVFKNEGGKVLTSLEELELCILLAEMSNGAAITKTKQ